MVVEEPGSSRALRGVSDRCRRRDASIYHWLDGGRVEDKPCHYSTHVTDKTLVVLAVWHTKQRKSPQRDVSCVTLLAPAKSFDRKGNVHCTELAQELSDGRSGRIS